MTIEPTLQSSDDTLGALQRTLKWFFVAWSIHAYGNYIAEWLPFMNSLLGILRMLADATLIAIALPSVRAVKLPVLKTLFFLFIITSCITFYINSGSVSFITHLNGLREPLILFLLFFYFIDKITGPDAEFFKQRVDKFLRIFIVIQLPVAVLQFLMYGAGDFVGGTFAVGGSGMLTQILFLIVYYFLINDFPHQDGKRLDFKAGASVLIFLVPIFINETKISLILLILFIILQFRFSGNWFKKIVYMLLGCVSIYSFIVIYGATNKFGDSFVQFLDEEEFAKYYLSDWEGSEDITRFGKLIILTNKYFDTDAKLNYGVGYGIMKGQNVLSRESIGKDMEYLWTGSRILLFTTLIQGGLAFTCILLAANIFFFVGGNGRTSSAFSRYRIFTFILFLLMWSYNEALLVTYSSIFMAYFLVFQKYYHRPPVDGLRRKIALSETGASERLIQDARE